jgi:hypothetical protein
MDEQQKTIGLTQLLDEVRRDLEELRRKNPNDYQIKNIVMWWDLEADRLLIRHGTSAILEQKIKVSAMKSLMGFFFAGLISSTILSAILRLLIW